MHYLFMLRFPEGAGPQEGTPELDEEMRRWGELTDELRAAGAAVVGSGLQMGSETTVRVRDGKTAITDGPYAESKEIAFSFFVLDVEDLDAATAWAAKMPNAEYGSVEIVPMVHYEFA